jgi:hypothetical protein
MTAARPVAAWLLVLVLAVGLAAGCAPASDERVRDELLALVPRTALERGVVVWSGALGEGFGSVRPAGALAEVLGVAAEEVEAVAESGGSPFTVLRVRTPPDVVRTAAVEAGYRAAEVDGWTVLRRPAGSGGALGAAVPAAAVRRGAVLIGAPDEVAAVVDGGPTVAEVRWAGVVSREAGAGALALAPARDVLEAAASRAGGPEAVLERAGARGDLPEWEGWGLGVAGDVGALVVVLPPGAADAAAAEALALRAATGPVLGDGRRAGDVLDGGAPRYDDGTGALRLPVGWSIAPPALRRDLEQGAFAFLLPGEG